MTRGVRINLKLGDKKEKDAGKIYIIESIIDWALRKASLGWSDIKGMRSAASVALVMVLTRGYRSCLIIQHPLNWKIILIRIQSK